MDEYEKQHLALLTRIAVALESKGAGPSASRPAAARTSNDGGAVFPPYGRSKGLPVAGASQQDLEFYRTGCIRTLDDRSKARFHDKERTLLAAIDDEISRNTGGGSGPPPDDAPPPPGDEDSPF